MTITCRQIVSKINNDFKDTYKGCSNFNSWLNIYNQCMKAVNDPNLMNLIIYRNDVFKIPPVKTFLENDTTLTGNFNEHQKKALGAFWGFVFKFVFNYQSQKENNPINIKGVKTASYFYNPKEKIWVI